MTLTTLVWVWGVFSYYLVTFVCIRYFKLYRIWEDSGSRGSASVIVWLFSPVLVPFVVSSLIVFSILGLLGLLMCKCSYALTNNEYKDK